jgi:stress-induced morphogen
MYELYVSSIDFKGKTMIKQHQILQNLLSNEIKEMHGIRITTKIPKD